MNKNGDLLKEYFQKMQKTVKLKINEMKLKKWEEQINKSDVKYETNKYVHNFQNLQNIRYFGDSIFNTKTTLCGPEKTKQFIRNYFTY